MKSLQSSQPLQPAVLGQNVARLQTKGNQIIAFSNSVLQIMKPWPHRAILSLPLAEMTIQASAGVEHSFAQCYETGAAAALAEA